MAVAMLTALTACGAADKTASSAAKEGTTAVAEDASKKEDEKTEGSYRVCFVARASADTFAAWMTKEMQNAAKQYDNIELSCVSGEGDDAKMAKQLEDCITKKYDLVIVQSNNNAAQAPYVQKLTEAGIPVITTNPTTHQSDLDGATGDDKVDNAVLAGTGTVDADPVEQAAVGARRAVKEVPQNANVVVLRGPSGNYHAEKRRESWETNFFSQRPDVKILYEDYANWNNDEAMKLMETWTQGGTHIDAVISMNDNMAAGAIEAVRNNTDYIAADGTPKFLAYGVDGTAQGCLLIREGFLTATALQDASEIAKLNMQYAEKVLSGEMKVTDVNDFVEAPEINKDNVTDFLKIYVENGELTSDALS